MPSPHAELEHLIVGKLHMGIYGAKEWAEREFAHLPFALPTVLQKIPAQSLSTLDLWPNGGNSRDVLYRFELLETALQAAYAGLCVLNCPSFLVRLLNERSVPGRRLIALTLQRSERRTVAQDVYVVALKGNKEIGIMSKKLARRLRLLKSAHPIP